MYMRRKDLETCKELSVIKTNPKTTTVGEAVRMILDRTEFPKIVRSGQVIITHKRIDQSKKIKKGSTTLSYLFDSPEFVRRRAFGKSLLLKQFLINGVTSIRFISIRGYDCYRIILTDRDYLYDDVDYDKKDYMIDLFSEETENERKRRELNEKLLKEANK